MSVLPPVSLCYYCLDPFIRVFVLFVRVDSNRRQCGPQIGRKFEKSVSIHHIISFSSFSYQYTFLSLTKQKHFECPTCILKCFLPVCHLLFLPSFFTLSVSALSCHHPSPVYPTTAQSLFIPPQVYLPSLSVYPSSAHCVVSLSSISSVCQFLSPPLSQ